MKQKPKSGRSRTTLAARSAPKWANDKNNNSARSNTQPDDLAEARDNNDAP